MKRLWRNHKYFAMRTLNVILLATVCIAYHNIASARSKKASGADTSVISQRSYKDGTYEGTGTGFGGDIVVSVTVKSEKISDIQIKEAKSEDAAYLDNAKKIINTMVQNQTSHVDVASGATYSSKGIIEAVQNALKEAS